MNDTTDQAIENYRAKSPVLFLVFNRPDTTKSVFEAIRQARPPRLYVAADGPRSDRPGEAEKCEEARRIATAVDWDCEMKTLFRETNMGCGPAVKASIDWFFGNEEAGIVLEDDTVATRGFFAFCDELLFKYQYDDRVAMIAGTNHIGYKPTYASYLFSKNKACWGWATWKRSWNNMDFAMSWRNSQQAQCILNNMGCTGLHQKHWQNALSAIDDERVSTWGWRWYFSVAAQSQLTIFPSINMVSNIGFGDNATHTKGSPRKEFIQTYDMDFPLVHPEFICPDFEYDKSFERKKMPGRRLRKYIPKSIKTFVRRVLK